MSNTVSFLFVVFQVPDLKHDQLTSHFDYLIYLDGGLLLAVELTVERMVECLG